MDVKEKLQQLEQQLLTSATRHHAGEISSLLADEFREFGSSGETFSKAEIISVLQSEGPVQSLSQGLRGISNFRSCVPDYLPCGEGSSGIACCRVFEEFGLD
jgi:hypothetical protein